MRRARSLGWMSQEDLDRKKAIMAKAEKMGNAKTEGSTQVIPMSKEKDCKGSVKYATADPKAVVSNVYVAREFAKEMPDTIVVTVAVGE